MAQGLWGHALFLASKMDQRTYSSVMIRFANGLALTDPLQTLYQLMSGSSPVLPPLSLSLSLSPFLSFCLSLFIDDLIIAY